MIDVVTAAFALTIHGAAGIPPFFPEGDAQLADPVRVFFDAGDGLDASTSAKQGDLAGALVLCRVDVVGDKGWDTFGAVDIRVLVSAGNRPVHEAWGPEDRSSAVIGMPGFDIKSGDKLKVVVEDRDVTDNELIGTRTVPFVKMPLRIDMEDTQVECRALAHSVALSRAQPAIAKAATSLFAFESAEPKLEVRGLGFPMSDYAAAADGAREAEAWLGKRDDDVKPLLTRIAKAESAFAAKASAKVDAAKRTLPAPGQTFRIASLGLNAKVTGGALVTIEVTPSSTSATFDDAELTSALMFLTAKSPAEHAAFTAAQLNASDASGRSSGGVDVANAKLTLKAGEVRTVRLRMSEGGLPDLMRVDDDVVVRVR